MAYTVQENKNNTNEEKTAIPEGDYLVRLENSKEDPNTKDFKTGGVQTALKLRFRICENQKYANLCLFKTIYKNEQGEYNFSFLSNMLQSLGFGEGTKFENIEDVLKILDNKEYLAHVKVDEKNPTRNYISFFKNNSVEFTSDEEEPF